MLLDGRLVNAEAAHHLRCIELFVAVPVRFKFARLSICEQQANAMMATFVARECEYGELGADSIQA